MSDKKQVAASTFSKNSIKKLLSAESPFAVKEAYNSIRTQLLFTGNAENCPVFAVTSAMLGDGKSINCVNLAITFAQMGYKTLVIDGDMRNPAIHRLFSARSNNGLSELLAGLTTSVNVRSTKIDNLSILTSGAIPPNPAELLGSSQMDHLLEFVRAHFSFVFIDTPPVLMVTDASIISTKITGYVFIVQAGKNEVGEIRSAVNTLQQLNGKISGFIVNDTKGKSSGYYKKYGYNYSYKYKYNYSYGEQIAAENKK